MTTRIGSTVGSAGGTTATLVGRDREREEIDRMLAAARAGDSRSLVVRGAAGVGKSALLAYAGERADACVILRAAGVETESDLAFAGLHGLLRPLADRLDELPERQANALGGVLGLRDSTGVDRLLVCAATLSMLALAADDGLVLCLVDDLQWLDAASAEALLFSARRLRAEPVALIFACRDDDLSAQSVAGIDRWQIGGLTRAHATQLLHEVVPHAAAAAVDWVLAQADGNPLALTELPAALSADQLEGRAALPEVVPPTERLVSAFTQRVEDLPSSSRTALLLVAVDDLADPATIMRAAREAGLDDGALGSAERSGIVDTVTGRIAFRHPLFRAAVLGTSTLTERHRAHEALAGALDSEQQADRRLWHRALAAMGPDADLAAALEGSGRQAESRGAHASAASALHRAAELSVTAEDRIDRLATAARCAWASGDPDRARQLVAEALPVAPGPVRGRLLHLRGEIEARTGGIRDAITLLLEAAEHTDSASTELELLAEATEAAAYVGDPEQAAALGVRAAVIAPETGVDRFRVASLGGLAAAFAGDHGRASEMFAEALELADQLDDPRALIWAARIATIAGMLGDGLPYATRAVNTARDRALISVLPIALQEQSTELMGQGRLKLAYAAAEEAIRLANDIGQQWGASWNLANLASIEAVWGDEARAREHASSAREVAAVSGATFVVALAEWALGLLDLTLGRPDDATERLLRVTPAQRPESDPLIALWATPDLVEAASRSGRLAEAAQQLERYRQWAQAAPSPRRLSMLARCHALTGSGDSLRAFTEASQLAHTLSPFQQARTELLFGEWLRRERRPTDARVHLRQAETLFRSIGAMQWEGRAQAELRATGETIRRRDPSDTDELTSQELQIAGLVSSGLTNRQIAAQLYLSPRTVEYHLRKVFTKLGISSRLELVQAARRRANDVDV